jgi:toxin ParE1/3/4
MAFEVRFSQEATDDLFEIWLYIARDSGVERANAVETRLRASCLKLADFPNRGTPQHEVEPGLRSIPFERRATIFYRVGWDSVEIVRIRYAGQDVAGMAGAWLQIEMVMAHLPPEGASDPSPSLQSDITPPPSEAPR